MTMFNYVQNIFKNKEFIDAVKFVFACNKASTLILQNEFGFEYKTALKYLDYMTAFGYISSLKKGRKVIASIDEFKSDAGEYFYAK